MSMDSVSNPDLGGSGLAREDGSTVNIDAICPTAFASKPAPTGIGGGHGCCVHPRARVGASLLAMAAAHSTSMQADPPLSRAGSLPQGIGSEQGWCVHPRTRVGASLLAMAVAHSTSMQADPPLSRAGSLPQGIGGEQGWCVPPRTRVGASLLAMAAAWSTSTQAEPLPIGQFSAPPPSRPGPVAGSRCCSGQCVSRPVWRPGVH